MGVSHLQSSLEARLAEFAPLHPPTVDHSVAVGGICDRVTEAVGLKSPYVRRVVRDAGVYHDIGKVGAAESPRHLEMLTTPRILATAERMEFRAWHQRVGQELISGMPANTRAEKIARAAIAIVAHNHHDPMMLLPNAIEIGQGTGIPPPDRLLITEIARAAIVLVHFADKLEALTSRHRIYRSPLAMPAARAVIRQELDRYPNRNSISFLNRDPDELLDLVG